MLKSNNLTGFGKRRVVGGGGGASSTLTFRGYGMGNPANSASQTISSISVGPASASRYVVAVISTTYYTAQTFTGITIGGVAATLLARDPSPTEPRVEIWGAIVPTGTTADVFLQTVGSNFARSFVALYTLITDTPTIPAYANVGTSSVSANVHENGCILFGAVHDDSAAMVFSGVGMTQDANDTNVNTSRFVSAHGNFGPAQSDLLLSTASTAADRCIYISWDNSPRVYRYFRFVHEADQHPFNSGCHDIQFSPDGGTTLYPTVIGDMTSNTAPSPLVASASSELSAGNAYKCFDANKTSNEYYGNNPDSDWNQVDLGAGNEIALPNFARFRWPASYRCDAGTLYASTTGVFAGEEVAALSFTGNTLLDHIVTP